jgi:magnesium-transporting ATPase (P-type)
LRNSGVVRGAVVYAGPDTRIQQNAARPPRKLGSFDRFLNVQIFLLLALQLSLCAGLAFCSAAWRHYAGTSRPHLAFGSESEGNLTSPAAYMGMLFVSFWILLSYMVPISLFVTMEIVKFVLCSVYIDRDTAMVRAETGEIKGWGGIGIWGWCHLSYYSPPTFPPFTLYSRSTRPPASPPAPAIRTSWKTWARSATSFRTRRAR